jgi:acyl-homoserine-lactone acylase
MQASRIKSATLALVLSAIVLGAAAQVRYSAEVRRTSFGIPHIKANDYGSIGYGLGFSFAEDNVCLLAEELVTVRGERSKFFGPNATNAYGYRNLALDFVMRYATDDTAALTARFNEQPDDVKALIRGYIAGYNRYLADTGAANLPADCRNRAWVTPMTELDFQKLIRRYTMESSYIPFLEGLVAARPPAVSEAPKRAADENWHGTFDPQVAGTFDRAFWSSRGDFTGSNALAVGRDGVESGRSLLLGTPHFPWLGTLRFYQMHLTIPGTLDVMGASLSGAPVVNIGFNQNIAWSHTNDKAWHFNLYQLRLVPGRPTSYIFDGVERTMSTKTITVDALNADGTLSPRSQTFYSSHLGPMVVATSLPIPWGTTFAYAMKDGNADNFRLIEQWYRMNRASSVEGLRSALIDVLGIPWVNTTAVDRDGNAMYSDISAVTNFERRQFATCLPDDITFAVVFGLGGPPTLKGTTSACEPVRTGDGLKAELIPGEEMPFLIRSDYGHNANDSYWLGNPREPLFDVRISPMVGNIEPQNLRTRIGLQQTLARLAGSDGRTGNKFNMRNLQDIALSNRSLAAEMYLADIIAACGTSVLADVKRGCDVLKAWDGKYELASVGGHVFYELFVRINANLENWARVPFSVSDPINTPRGLNVTQAAVANGINSALDAAVKALDALRIPLNRPWGQVNLSVKGPTTFIPIHGGPGTALGIYNAINNTRVQGLGYAVITGTSYIQTVAFSESGPTAEGFLTYSQSVNPASPNYADQTVRFSAKNWIKLPFTEAEIAADPNLRTRTLTN